MDIIFFIWTSFSCIWSDRYDWKNMAASAESRKSYMIWDR